MTNEEGKTGTASASVTVNDVGPQFTAADLSATPATDQPRGRHGHAGRRVHRSRPAQRITATIDWGDGTAPTVLYGLFNEIAATATPGLIRISAAHQYMSQRQTTTITVSVSDGTVTTIGQHLDRGEPRRTHDPDRECRRRRRPRTVSLTASSPSRARAKPRR